jgi:hypothetical protein
MVEEKEVGENEIDVIVEKKVEINDFKLKLKEFQLKMGKALSSGRTCSKGLCEKIRKNKWAAVGVIALLFIVAASFAYKSYRQRIDVGPEVVKAKVEKFLSENVPATTKTEIKDIKKDGDLYSVTIALDKQEVPVFVTRDGRKLIQAQGVIELDKTPTADAKEAQAPEKTEAENKTDVPTVDLFVMSYCPYGLQMEKGALPAVEALGKKIKFNLKFVDYTLHGPKEVTENVNQYCVEKTQPAKLDAYLKCFWKSSTGTSAGCMKAVGINAASVATCVSDTNKQFNPTEKALGLNKDEAAQFGVQGSPTLVINGTKVASGRDSASVLKAICSGFTTAPKECEAKLSTTSPSAGFDDQASAAAGGTAPAASCATN